MDSGRYAMTLRGRPVNEPERRLAIDERLGEAAGLDERREVLVPVSGEVFVDSSDSEPASALRDFDVADHLEAF